MGGDSRKWVVLLVTVWIQAFTGTNFDFSAYSTELKAVLGVSQFLLNYLAVASDLGKAFGWSSGLALLHIPVSAALVIAASLGLFGYGLQWLVINRIISLPYQLVFALCLVAGLSICWFNTVCFVLCNQCFPTNRSLALALTVSFNGLSPAIYDLAAHSLSIASHALPSLYLLLNALLPLVVSLATLLPVARYGAILSSSFSASILADSLVFLVLNLLAVLIGAYLVLVDAFSFSSIAVYRALFLVAVLLLCVPMAIPSIVYGAREDAYQSVHRSFRVSSSGFNLVAVDDLELHKELLSRPTDGGVLFEKEESTEPKEAWWWWRWAKRDELVILGDEHGVRRLVKRADFWLYYLGYFCGGTVGLVYSNNLGQIFQSLGGGRDTVALVSLYSTCSFFGRLLSASPDFFRGRAYFARTGWLAIALIPTPAAFFLLAFSGSLTSLYVATALVGLSSGFIFAAAVSVTSELFGVQSFGVNHNVLISNIPLGSLLYGSMAALVYDANGEERDGATVCMGRECYTLTFVAWACVSLFGLLCNALLFWRTRLAYDLFERTRRGLDPEI